MVLLWTKFVCVLCLVKYKLVEFVVSIGKIQNVCHYLPCSFTRSDALITMTYALISLKF